MPAAVSPATDHGVAAMKVGLPTGVKRNRVTEPVQQANRSPEDDPVLVADGPSQKKRKVNLAFVSVVKGEHPFENHPISCLSNPCTSASNKRRAPIFEAQSHPGRTPTATS